MSETPAIPNCDDCSSLALVSYRIKPKGRDAQPVTINTCGLHAKNITERGLILRIDTHGEPVRRKLGES